MLKRPKISERFHTEILGGEGVFLLSETGSFALSGPVYEALVPLLDGSLTADEIVERLQGRVPPVGVYYALTVMERKGYLAEAHPGLAPGESALWDSLGLDAATARDRLESGAIPVIPLGDDPAARALQAALDSHGIGKRGAHPALDLVLVADYLDGRLEGINRRHLAGGGPWMPLKLTGTSIWLGPIFVPGRTACWECLAQRLRSNREVERFVARRRNLPPSLPLGRARTGATVSLAAQMAAFEAAKWVARGGGGPLEGALLTVDLLRMETREHALVRRPQCPSCGTPPDPARDPGPVRLQSRQKGFTADGGHRLWHPEKTVRLYEKHVSPHTGVVTHLFRTAPDDSPAHVYVAGHNFAMRHESLYYLKRGLRTKSSGKGMEDLQARASAICEAIERYSGNFQGDEPRRPGRLRDLGEGAVHPNALMNFSARQYERRDSWNSKVRKFHFVPLPFQEEAEIEWSPAWSLTADRTRWVPTAYCYFGYPADPARAFAWPDSNGNAAGNSLEEAILQGFMELVERDAVALWWYSRVRRPGVCLESFGEPYFEELLRYYRSQGREIWVLDLTGDLDIPAFAAITRRTAGETEDIALGFGAHFDARLAITRALTELAQVTPRSVVGEDGKPGYDFEDEDSQEWWRTATVENQPYLLPSPEAGPFDRSRYGHDWGQDLRDDVERCASLVASKGMEMLVLDQTRPDIGMPVVKVMVPGLRHFWARFGPGRLYDVPLELGWVDRRLDESELNPIPIFV